VLRPVVRASLAGESESGDMTLDATNRRGKRIRCRTRLTTAELAALPGVRDARRLPNDEIEIVAAAAEPVVRLLLSRDPDLSGLDVRGAGLEEAFLALTGSDHFPEKNEKEVAA